MVKILVLSDLHLECLGFKPSLAAVRATDVIVLAGDIHQGSSGIIWARETFGDKPVVYVAGNHEFYDGYWEETLEQMRRDAKAWDVYFLENETVMIEGVRFLGCTLWTDFAYHGEYLVKKIKYQAERWFSDYHAISLDRAHARLTANATLARHQASRAWLKSEMPKGVPASTVVVTHHYPHRNSTATKYLSDAMTAAFGSHLPHELLLQAGLWIHGHTHGSCDYRLDSEPLGDNRYLRVVCNPRGYQNGMTTEEMENPKFNPDLLMTQLPDGNWAELYEFRKCL